MIPLYPNGAGIPYKLLLEYFIITGSFQLVAFSGKSDMSPKCIFQRVTAVEDAGE